VLDGSAWRDFCQALERAGQVILEEGSPEDAFERAEGLRYLTRLTRAAFETFIEDCDPGAARAPLSAARLAALMNWLVERFTGKPPTPTYTANEVAQLRSTPLRDPIGKRKTLLEY
jgi:hypothetical protein